MQQLTANNHSREVTPSNDDKDDHILPGAWPITPAHKGPRTHPLQSQERAMHQHRHLFQPYEQKENGTSPESFPSCDGFGPSSSSSGVPSDDSTLTRFTPSKSAATVESVTSSSTMVTSLGTRISEPEIAESGGPFEGVCRRIHGPLPRKDCDASRVTTRLQVPSHAEDAFPRAPALSSTKFPSGTLTPPTSSPHSQFTRSPGSITSFQSSLSPILFTSPTSSYRPRRTRIDVDNSYDYDSSWKSSGDDSAHEISSFLRIGSPSPTPSPSPSPVSTHDCDHRGTLTVSVTSPSVDELPLPPQVMLTTLSLPGSLHNDTLSLNLPVPLGRQHAPSSMDRSNSDTPASLSLTPASEVSDPMGASTTTTSPSSRFEADLESPSRTHFVRLPSSSPSPESLPASVAQRRESFSATEYAHAVVMSSWGSNDACLRPLVSPSDVSPAIIPDVSLSHSLSEGPINPNRSRRSVTFAEDPRPRGGILRRVKKLGSKFRRFFLGQARLRTQTVSISKRSASVQHTHDLVDISANQSVESQILPRLELEIGGEELAGVLASRTRRQRPSLTPETYTPSDDPNTTSPSERSSPVGEGGQGISERPVDEMDASGSPEGGISPQFEFQDQLTEHARPKTVEEIKAKRPFSISALPNFSGSPSSGSKPSPRSQRRSRPVSDLVMMSPNSSLYRQARTAGLHRGYSASHVVLPSARQSLIPPPPGLEGSVQSGRETLLGNVNRNSSPSLPNERHALARPLSAPTTPTKETRRFSLSALSSFAAGLKQQGTWARYSENTRRES